MRRKSLLAASINSIISDNKSNIILYTSSDDNIVIPNWYDYPLLMSNIYENDQGILTFNFSVKDIPESAFENCTNLISIVIPTTVTSILYDAFKNCTNLISIIIPKNVTNIYDNTFNGCSSLSFINVDIDNSTYDSREDCNAIIETEINKLITGCKNTVIPNSVTRIGPKAFSNCIGLTSIEIPNSVTTIGYRAFYGCSSLTSIEIPNSVTSIEESAFEGTAWYNNQPDGVVYAGKVLYKYKGTMPSNTSITIKDGTLSIGYNAFLGCSSLTSIVIPDSVTSIGYSAFGGCTNLERAIINCANVSGWFNSSALSLKEIVLGEGVTSIGTKAFYDYTGLTSITSKAITPPAVYYLSFLGVNKYIPVYVPAESVDAYKTATGWDYFTNIQAMVG